MIFRQLFLWIEPGSQYLTQTCTQLVNEHQTEYIVANSEYKETLLWMMAGVGFTTAIWLQLGWKFLNWRYLQLRKKAIFKNLTVRPLDRLNKDNDISDKL